MSKATTVKEVLIAMEWILTNVGWCQGTGYRDKEGHPMEVKIWGAQLELKRLGSCCVIGASYLVHKEDPTLFLRVNALLRDLLPEVFSHDLARFNDAPSTTKEDVLRLIREGIESSP